LKIVPGKEALSAVNVAFQSEYGISVTATAIVDAMKIAEVAAEMQSLIGDLAEFSMSKWT
jgi:hypothetical protein